jgi:hypothetical protein
MLFLERMYMAIVVVGLWLRRRRPKRPSRRGVIALAADDDMEAATDRFPMVLIQIPMFNEKQVRAAGRGDCCLDTLHLQLFSDALYSTQFAFLSTPTLCCSYYPKMCMQGLRVPFRELLAVPRFCFVWWCPKKGCFSCLLASLTCN